MHILIVEDDLDLGRALLQGLKAEGITSEWVRRGADALHAIEAPAVDCVLLDVSLPDGTGYDLLSRWRLAGVSVPIIIITARSALEERVAGLDGGADDFLVKPFATVELVSRIRAVARRSAQQASEVWTFGDLQIEPRRHVATIAGEPLKLSPREFRLLLELSREAGTVVSKGVLSQRLEPLGDPLDFGAIEVHVSNLRRRIGPQRIRTVRGVGYMLVP
jgi:two-component system, OmpR family, response regulator QseB